jgi:hypothetical protein
VPGEAVAVGSRRCGGRGVVGAGRGGGHVWWWQVPRAVARRGDVDLCVLILHLSPTILL